MGKDFLKREQKALTIKEKSNKLNYVVIQSSVQPEDCKRVKQQTIAWERVLAIQVISKRFVSRINKYQLGNREEGKGRWGGREKSRL